MAKFTSFCYFLSFLFIANAQFTDLVSKCRDDPVPCVSIPPACLVNEDAGPCRAVVYASVNNETITNFAMSTNGTAGYIALGFSDDTDLGSEAVIDCGLAVAGIRAAYNNESKNILLEEGVIEGLTLLEMAPALEGLYCEFEIKQDLQVGSYSVPYNESYYLILAYGDKLNLDAPTELTMDKLVVSERRFTLNAPSSGAVLSLATLALVTSLLAALTH